MGIVFRITSRHNGLAFGTLRWAEKNLSAGAVSGPYGRNELPLGLYHAQRSELLDKKGEEGYCDSLRQCWMQVIRPQFSTARTDLGIHPDGNKSGTLGCIGLVDADTAAWYAAFKAMSAAEVLTVEVF
ncbi:MAG: hypothetical protein V4693_18190 [Pseudomonadota bacterium]